MILEEPVHDLNRHFLVMNLLFVLSLFTECFSQTK